MEVGKGEGRFCVRATPWARAAHPKIRPTSTRKAAVNGALLPQLWCDARLWCDPRLSSAGGALLLQLWCDPRLSSAGGVLMLQLWCKGPTGPGLQDQGHRMCSPS